MVCEDAKWNSDVVRGEMGKAGGISTAHVHDDGTTVRIALTTWSNGTQFSCATTESGTVIWGLRVRGGCTAGNPILAGQRLTLQASEPYEVTKPARAALLVDLSTGSLNLAEFRQRPDKVPQWATQNGERVAWWWVLGDELSSFSAIDGSDFRFFVSATYQGPVLSVRVPVGFPGGFFYEALTLLDGGSAQRTLFVSSGLDAGERLVPTEAGFDYAQAEYLHSHVAWLRGKDPVSTNLYESVEIWAAPWSSGTLGTPERVGTLDTLVDGRGHGIPPDTSGGFGHYLAPFGDGETFGRAEVWSIEKRTRKKNDLPPSATALAPSGVTRAHAYVNARKPALGHPLQTRLLRFPIE